MVNKKGGMEIAYRPQSIIEARFDLSNKENDIIDMLFSKVGGKGDKEDNLEYTLDIKEYKEIYIIEDKSNVYKYVKKSHCTLMNKNFVIASPDKTKGIKINWISSIEWNDDEKIIKVEIGKRLKKLITEAKQGCFYRLEYSINLKKQYSKRIYYYLKDHENYKKLPNQQGVFKISFEELKIIIQSAKSYDEWKAFNRNILKPTQEEINSNTDIIFDYKKDKKDMIEFKVTSIPKKRDIVDAEISCTSEEVQKIFDMFECSVFEAESLYNTALKNNRSWDETMEILDYTIKQKTDNKVGYALSLLKKGFSKPQATKGKTKPNSFHNFESRTYTKEQNEEREKILISKAFKDLDNYEVDGQIELDGIPGVKPK